MCVTIVNDVGPSRERKQLVNECLQLLDETTVSGSIGLALYECQSE